MLKILDEETLMAMTRKAVDEKLKECSEDLLKEAKERVPVHEGILRDSGFDDVAYDLQTDNRRVWEIWFDTSVNTGKPFNYAIIRHEVPPKAGSGLADHTKFLERPYLEKLELYKSLIQSGAIEGLTSVKFRSTITITPKTR
jgi:hypothetical protein